MCIRDSSKTKLRVIPLGGLGEIGKNLTVFEYGNDIVVIDCGMTFPDDEMPVSYTHLIKPCQLPRQAANR